VNIAFCSDRLCTECNNQKLLVRRHGSRRAARIMQRLDELTAAPTLDVMRTLPGRCHELQGDRASQLSLDLDHPWRLIFEPHHDPVPVKPDGGLDWTQVTSILVLGVEDTHG
jgi:plasmid maintenance system killer protein